MSEERKKVLEMLAAGKITAEEAEKLLDRLAAPGEGKPDVVAAAGAKNGQGRRPPRYIRVQVDEGPGEQINIRVPLGLVRAGLKIGTMLPKGVHSKLCAEGVDLTALSGMAGEELVAALCDLNVDVDSKEEGKIRIYCE